MKQYTFFFVGMCLLFFNFSAHAIMASGETTSPKPILSFQAEKSRFISLIMVEKEDKKINVYAIHKNNRLTVLGDDAFKKTIQEALKNSVYNFNFPGWDPCDVWVNDEDGFKMAPCSYSHFFKRIKNSIDNEWAVVEVLSVDA